MTKYKNVKKSVFYIRDTDQEHYEMIQDAREGGSLKLEYYKIVFQHVKNKKINPLKHSTIKEHSWDKKSKFWDLVLETKPEAKSDVFETEILHLSEVDYIDFATGIKQNISALDFLQSIIKEHPIAIVEGFPVITDDLQCNKTLPLIISEKRPHH